ncbi:MAG: class I SAM-dependent methyltransferase [Rhodospirillaceae bacterium]|nr:class I SAM-dependent methyltransferase [Rhodospirillaceae bacterium]
MTVSPEHGAAIDEWARALLSDPDMQQMGHGQSATDLGLGWLYYALARTQKPAHAVVIGSWRGFVPLILGKALHDAGHGGTVTFVDPSLVDDFWADPARAAAQFARFGVSNVCHHRMTSQEFAASPAFAALPPVGLLFVDGLHTFEQAKFDHETFVPFLTDDAVVLFHDSIRVRTSRIYGPDRAYEHRVKDYMDSLRADPAFEVLAFPLGDGLTLVRRRGAPA